jgi:hypothetical protein
MPRQVCAFWEDEPDPDGWVRVTQINHRPETLDPAVAARGVVANLGRIPEAKAGWTSTLFAHAETGVLEWRLVMDKSYRMPAAEFLLQLPVAARIQARQAAAQGDLVMQDFLDMVDRLISDNAALGIHPGSETAKVALGYLVEKGWMTAEEVSAITEG